MGVKREKMGWVSSWEKGQRERYFFRGGKYFVVFAWECEFEVENVLVFLLGM